MTDAIATLLTAVAAAGGAVAGSVVSAVVTYKVTNRQVSSAEKVAAEEREHERDLAKEALHQRRLEEAYFALADWVLATDDDLNGFIRGNRPEESEESKAARLRSRTIASLHGSAYVGKLVGQYSGEIRSTFEIVGDRHFNQVLLSEVEPLVVAAKKAGERLLEAMREEMGSKGQLPSEFPGTSST